MKQTRSLSHIAAWLSFALAAAFLVLLAALHFLEPEFDPSWRMISEYERGEYGWLMSLAFFCLAGSTLLLLLAVWPSLRTLGGWIGRIWLVLLTLAFIGAGVFISQDINAAQTTLSEDLHNLCGLFVILTFPIAASLVAGSLGRSLEWTSSRRRLLRYTLITWIGLIVFLGSSIYFAQISTSDTYGPEFAIGWPNRFVMVTYVVWLMAVAWRATVAVRDDPLQRLG